MASLNIDSWTPNDVASWIRGLGAQFESSSEGFVEEEINGKALLTINVEYLSELSIENTADQNAVLDAVHCLVEVESCLQSETVHGQVIIVSNETKSLIEQLEKESSEAGDQDVRTSESSMKMAASVYHLAKKLLSWLLRSPFSEMNACWPFKDTICRVVRDMTDESLLKNREYLKENLTKLQRSFDTFLNEEPLHEVFKQQPILVDEEFVLEGEGLGIGITTSNLIHTVNSVATDSPAGKNGNIKSGDEIVSVNGQCVIAWPQKNVVSLMKTKTDSVSLTLKKLPPVKGPLNKLPDKPGTPLSEMNVVMDHIKVPNERPSRVEIKEAGIKEETSLEMQAIENENAAEEKSKVEAIIEDNVEEKVEKPTENEVKTIDMEQQVNVEKETGSVSPGQSEVTVTTQEFVKKLESEKEHDNKQAESIEGQKNSEKPVVEDVPVVSKNEEVSEGKPSVDKGAPLSAGDKGLKSEAKEDAVEVKEIVKNGDDKKVHGEAVANVTLDVKNKKETTETKSKPSVEENTDKSTIKIPQVSHDVETGLKEDSLKKDASRPTRPDLPKMKIGSVKNVTVGGTSAKQVEVYCVRRREKKSQVDGAPNKRISCIDLGDAEREGWLTKKSGGHGLAPTRWRRHWCVLKDNHLYYYKTAFDKEAVGMIQIAGYKMSPAPEQKKPFCFKCEKEGGKGYFFYADNELERENWINILNISSRGERKFREPGLGQINQSAERERKTSDSSSLRISTSNVRPRTSSVLAGIRFDYHDDDDDHVGLKRQSIAVVSNEGTNVNGKNVDPEPSKAEEKTNGQNILKIAENYGEDSSQDVFLHTKDKNVLVNGNSDIVTKSSKESSTKPVDTSIKVDEEIKESSYSSKSDKGGQGAKY